MTGVTQPGYIEKSRAKEWALFYLSVKNHPANELSFGMSNYSKYNLSKDFEKLKTLLFIQPKQRSQESLREIQLYLKKNRAFHSLPNEVQLQLCQTAIYQEFEAGSVLLRQGHVPLECYLILAGHLKVMSSNTSMNKITNSEILSEFEEGDFIGETCLLTNANRPASILCKTDAKALVISKEDFYCILAQRVQEQYQEACSLLRNLSLFRSWPKEKIDFLLHCSLHRHYRTGTTIISDNLNSYFLVFIISGRCRIIAKMKCEEISVCSCVMKTGSSTLKNVHTVLPPKGTLDVTERSLETSTVSPKTSFSAARKKKLDTKKPPLQGLEETLDNSCDLHLYLISQGAECIFIPKNLFLAEASPESRSAALELVCAHPAEEAVREYLARQQVWHEYKARLLAQQLKTGSRPTGSAHFDF
ncbi:PREDICTED: cyclic nucleotide-binding domain-containing protein 2-like isoform X2 [Miniopterus natalensis]|uniref:cyclic nucleotide-binding domain-containing protein 2-like isoform X2 n=1 Tax=Miniopterus natalensis TaxID=291302 RepID=UPI0007A72C7E|nr:PREDICTED: cyclic nucleotide-binding domain-containing protein 2-like isoform X2 [Miniopterus natalensis]